jgi:hypothetical protein
LPNRKNAFGIFFKIFFGQTNGNPNSFYFREKIDVIKRNLSSTNRNFQNVKLTIFRGIFFFGRNRRREEKETDIQEFRTQGKAAAGTKQASKEGSWERGRDMGGVGEGEKEGEEKVQVKNTCKISMR